MPTRVITMASVVRILPAAVLGLALAAPAFAHDGDGVSRTGTCTKSSSTRIELRREDRSGPDGGEASEGDSDRVIDVAFTVRSRRSGVAWRVVLLHERRIVFRGKLRTRAPQARFILRRSLPDWYGSEVVAGRATSPSGEVCVASARL